MLAQWLHGFGDAGACNRKVFDNVRVAWRAGLEHHIVQGLTLMPYPEFRPETIALRG